MGELVRALVVGPDEDAASNLARECERRTDGLATVAVAGAEAALDALDDVDCLITDHGRDLDGVGLVEAVRDRREGLPVVVYTAADAAETERRALAADVTDYLRSDRVGVQALADRVERHGRRYRLRRQHRENSDLLDAIFEQVPTHLYVKDREGRHVRVSEHATDDPEALIGKTDAEVYECGDETLADDRRVMETGEPVVDKEEEGPRIWNLTSKVPWRGRDGEIRGLIGVSRPITRQKRYEQQLEHQVELLEHFASTVSHDLRNPLSVAMGHLELAAAEDDGDDHLERVGDALDRADEIVEGMLSMVREGRIVTEQERVSLREISRTCWANVDTGAASLRVESDLAFLADRRRLTHLFENLFRNAVEHGTESDGRGATDGGDPGDGLVVTVGSRWGGGFFVADDGRGIPPEDRERVLEHGYSTSTDGSGYGLEIVAWIARAHGWTVEIDESDDGGARFVFSEVEPAE